MRKIYKLALIGLAFGTLGWILAGQEPVKTQKVADIAKPLAATPPTLPDALLKIYWKASSDYISAQQVADAKRAVLQNAVEELRKGCGESFTLTANTNGDPVCVPKPEPAKAEPVKK